MILVNTNILADLTRPLRAPWELARIDTAVPQLAGRMIGLGDLRCEIEWLPSGRLQLGLPGWWRGTQNHFPGRILAVRSRGAQVCGDAATGADRGDEFLGVVEGRIAESVLAHGMEFAMHNVIDSEASGTSLVSPWD